MATIVRCPQCISLVYEGDPHCHHCGEELSGSRPRILNRGAILFIVLVVGLFATVDAISLIGDERNRRRLDENVIDQVARWIVLGDKFGDRVYVGELDPITRQRNELTGLGNFRDIRVREFHFVQHGRVLVYRGSDGNVRDRPARIYQLNLRVDSKERRQEWTFPVLASVVGEGSYTRVASIEIQAPPPTPPVVVAAPGG
jgi:hypothetical protein